ncbi:hypothetical protein KIN20_033166 [Parelaphostrongylus tenuis]|uniref:Uncharacterized protein n=1 Tax=Parelaphostrongylus tenuis TaxID=148309 RepID=A0AAD5R816_PARTN|nr:hypothetical protein KIN20_033144 [Parelaphostrongylus tenuis]KAJ1371252.1 hypothetical protein KIN20_033166 [Parelaphostrongylus tenuis]
MWGTAYLQMVSRVSQQENKKFQTSEGRAQSFYLKRVTEGIFATTVQHASLNVLCKFDEDVHSHLSKLDFARDSAA